MTQLKHIEDVANFITDILREQHGSLLEADLEKVRKSIADNSGINEKLSERLARSLFTLEPAEKIPEWLHVIDDFFMLPSNKDIPVQFKKNIQYRGSFLTIIELISSFVYFDHILNLKAFDDDVIGQVEVGFLTLINVPRDTVEAKRVYESILKLPKKYEINTVDGKVVTSQPFMAQMMFAWFIGQENATGSDQYQFQYDCINSCPSYLLDIPEISSGGSYRPSFWIAHLVKDNSLRELVIQKGSKQISRDFDKVFPYEKEQELAQKQLEGIDSKGLEDEVSVAYPNQEELVKLLEEFDNYLKENAKEVYDSLLPGVSNQQIEKLNKELAPLRIPDDLATFYKWHNGVEFDKFLFGFPDIYSIQDSLQQYRNSIEIFGDFSWCKAWFPIAYESRVYRLVPLSESNVEKAPMFYHDIEGGDVEIHHFTILEMLKTYFEAYKQEVIFYDKDDERWDINEDEFERLRLKMNPGSYSYPDKPEAAYDLQDTSGWPEEWKKHYIGELNN